MRAAFATGLALAGLTALNVMRLIPPQDFSEFAGSPRQSAFPAEQIGRLSEAASERERRLAEGYRREVSEALSRAGAEAEQAARAAAKDLSRMGFLAEFVKLSVVDVFNKSREAEALVMSKCAGLCAVFETLSARLNESGARLRSGIEEVNRGYGAELFQFVSARSPEAAPGAPAVTGRMLEGFQMSVRIKTALLAGAVVIEVVQREATIEAFRRLAAWMAKLLEPVIGKAVMSVIPAAADGPVPILDILTAVGFAWTAWEVWHFQGNVEREALALFERHTELALSRARESAEQYEAGLCRAAAEARERARALALATLTSTASR